MKILVAEDDAVSRLILRRAVEKLGHECIVAEDGEIAWSIYKETSGVDVVISDWMMPGMDGPDLCRKIRAEKRDGYTFFVFLTALGDREHLLEGMQAGADDYLAKPLDREQLEVRLIAASRVTSLHRQLAGQNAELERLNGELFVASRRDPLTLLGNRLRLHEDLEALSAQAERYGYSYCAILCDIDNFKLYNDTHGHLAGDEVLKAVARAMERTIRLGDTLYRYGGEELLVITPGQTLQSAWQAAERLRLEVEQLDIERETDLEPKDITISLGLAILESGESKSADELLKQADEALYRAKQEDATEQPYTNL